LPFRKFREKKLNEIGNIYFLNNNNKNRYTYIQTDRQIDIDLGNVKMHRKRTYNLTFR